MTKPTAAKRPKAAPPASPERKRLASYHQENREKRLEQMRGRYAALSPLEKAMVSFRSKARPGKPRRGSARGATARYFGVAQAYCEWSDVEEVVRMYLAAGIMTQLTGQPYVVDHIIPIANPFVCGLHTHTNMQVVSAAFNRRKGNWLWPGMSALTWESMEAIEELEKWR